MSCNKFFTVISVMAAVLFLIAVIGLGAWCSYLYIAPEERTVAKVTDVTTGEQVNILFLGTDEGTLMTETAMLLSFDLEKNRLNILSVPKQVRVRREGVGYPFHSLYAMGKEGNRHEEPIRYVKEQTRLPIHYYAVVHPQAIRSIVDILGGVWLDVPHRMYYRDGDFTVDLSAGYQLLDGEKAEQFIRFKAEDSDADLQTLNACRYLVAELIHQKATPRYAGKVPELLKALSRHVETNITASDFSLFFKCLNDSSDLRVSIFQMPVSKETKNGISYVDCDVDKTRKLVRREFLGEQVQKP